IGALKEEVSERIVLRIRCADELTQRLDSYGRPSRRGAGDSTKDDERGPSLLIRAEFRDGPVCIGVGVYDDASGIRPESGIKREPACIGTRQDSSYAPEPPGRPATR